MIGFFPELYPDELLYSALARYHIRSGHIQYTSTAAEIYKNDRDTHPDIEFVNKLTEDALNWICRNKTWEHIIHQHTMYPIYARFLPQERRDNALAALRNCEGIWRNLMSIQKSDEKRFLKYCPVCAEEDREKYGETYWHRLHQVQKVRICPKHQCFLENSSIPISSKSSPGLHDAEAVVPIKHNLQACSQEREVIFTKYLLDILQEPLATSPLAIGVFLHSRLSHKYVSQSGLKRNMECLYSDYSEFYHEDMSKMTQSYMQKIFNGYAFDPYFILQLAFFQGISPYEILHPPTEKPSYGLETLYTELGQKYNIDYSIVCDIGNKILQHLNAPSRASKKSGPQIQKYEELDERLLPNVMEIVDEILHQPGRPEKLSFAKVQKRLHIPQKQIFKLPKCREYIEQNLETQAEYWAREVTWAVGELQKNNIPVNFRQISNLTNMRTRDIICCQAYISSPEIQELFQILSDKT